jgi:hypothetical protein
MRARQPTERTARRVTLLLAECAREASPFYALRDVVVSCLVPLLLRLEWDARLDAALRAARPGGWLLSAAGDAVVHGEEPRLMYCDRGAHYPYHGRTVRVPSVFWGWAEVSDFEHRTAEPIFAAWPAESAPARFNRENAWLWDTLAFLLRILWPPLLLFIVVRAGPIGE